MKDNREFSLTKLIHPTQKAALADWRYYDHNKLEYYNN